MDPPHGTTFVRSDASRVGPIPGTSSVEHLEDNVAATGIELTDSEYNAISSAV